MDQISPQSDAQFQQDTDSLYFLPLRILPIKAAALQRARMIKDARLESAIELFSGRDTGSGQACEPRPR